MVGHTQEVPQRSRNQSSNRVDGRTMVDPAQVPLDGVFLPRCIRELVLLLDQRRRVGWDSLSGCQQVRTGQIVPLAHLLFQRRSPFCRGMSKWRHMTPIYGRYTTTKLSMADQNQNQNHSLQIEI